MNEQITQSKNMIKKIPHIYQFFRLFLIAFVGKGL